MAKKLTEKSMSIEVPEIIAGQTGVKLAKKYQTGLGINNNQITKEHEENSKISELQAKLKKFDGSLLTIRIDPDRIVSSDFANRSQDEFSTPEFEVLRNEIKNSNGNVQPIKVRPKEGGLYEIVYGHRRYEACKLEGLQVLAMVEDINDEKLWIDMDRENRGRKALSPYDQGKSFERALSSNLFSSQAVMCRAIGVDDGNLSKYLKIAGLPTVVVKAFPSTADITTRMVGPLNEALSKDPEGVMDRAKKISGREGRTAGQVLTFLIGLDGPVPYRINIDYEDKSIGSIEEKKGGYFISTKVKLNLDELESKLKGILVRALESDENKGVMN